MKKSIFSIFIILVISNAVNTQQNECSPRLVRLLIGDKYSSESSPYTATLMYQTYKECSNSGIVFRNDKNYQTSALQTYHSQWNDQFCHNKKKNCEQVIYDQFIHTIKIAVDPQVEFSYSLCEDSLNQTGCTSDFTSKMPPLPLAQQQIKPMSSFLGNRIQDSSALKILFFGDHDLSNAGQITFASLFKTLEVTKFDAFIFLGDYGYEFYQNNGKVGDDYIEMLSKINTIAPMAITAGNHEDNFNFKFFNEKFQMPSYNETQNNYYSFEIGNTHFLNLNLHFFNDQQNQPNPNEQQKMLEWVENDLKNVDRTKTPWIIAFGHKMIYCKGSGCEQFASDYSEFDTLLNKYKVDLFIAGHQHEYQVMKPMKDGKPAKYSTKENNTIYDYEGFITVIQGNGGTNKYEENDNMNNIFKNLYGIKKYESTSFDKDAQKKARLYEFDGLGYGVLNIFDNNINIQSFNSQTNTLAYNLNLNK